MAGARFVGRIAAPSAKQNCFRATMKGSSAIRAGDGGADFTGGLDP